MKKSEKAIMSTLGIITVGALLYAHHCDTERSIVLGKYLNEKDLNKGLMGTIKELSFNLGKKSQK